MSSDALYVPSSSESDTDDELDVMAALSPPIQRTRRANHSTTIIIPRKGKRTRTISTGNTDEARKRAAIRHQMGNKKAVGSIFFHIDQRLVLTRLFDRLLVP
jgi:hypothetical protein